MRCMTRTRDHPRLQRACRDALEDTQLLICAVWVIGTLQRQDRHLDPRHLFCDVEVEKARIEPGVVPSTECNIDVTVIARQSLAQIAGGVSVSYHPDRRGVDVLNEKMGS